MLLAPALITGCIKESLDPCPENEVRIRLRAEEFGADPAGTEPVFGKRVASLRYALYSGGALIWERRADGLDEVTGDAYYLSLGALEMRDYTLTVSANVPDGHYESSAAEPESYAVAYQGPDKTRDYFSAVIPFTVDCTCPLTFDGTLQRLHTVVRTLLYNVPDGTASAEISISDVSERRFVADGYGGVTSATMRSDVDNIPGEAVRIVVGTFPTAGDGASVYRIRLFGADGQTAYEREIAGLRLKRNRLTDVTVRFPENPGGEIEVEVKLDTRWDGNENGGSTEIS